MKQYSLRWDLHLTSSATLLAHCKQHAALVRNVGTVRNSLVKQDSILQRDRKDIPSTSPCHIRGFLYDVAVVCMCVG